MVILDEMMDEVMMMGEVMVGEVVLGGWRWGFKGGDVCIRRGDGFVWWRLERGLALNESDRKGRKGVHLPLGAKFLLERVSDVFRCCRTALTVASA